jgi:SOS response regulatory protein OraA/RecX
LKKKSIGKRTLQFELRKKGISEDIISSVMKDIFAGHSELEDAIAAANKKIRTYRGGEASQIRVKLMRFLHQRGFSPDTIRTVIGRLLK